MIFALILATFPFFATAQSQPDNFGESLEVRIVSVDVVVRDKDGKPVPGLTAEDFVLLENGKAKAISNFAEYREAGPEIAEQEPGTVPAVAARPPQRRYIAFFIDRLTLREKINREEFFRGLRAFVDDSMREGDEGAIFVWGTSLEIRLSMTADRASLVGAISALEEAAKLQLDHTNIELSELQFREKAWAGDPSAGSMIETDRRNAAQRAFDLQQRKTYAINAVLQSLAGLDGKKVMILATERFSMLPGLEYGYPSTEFNARRMIDGVVDEANAATVTVYGVLPRGLDRDPMAQGAGSYEAASGTSEGGPMANAYDLLSNEATTIDSIATRTGGTAAIGGKLSALSLDSAAQHLDNYYSLAYRPSGDDRTRSIKVKVNRPGLKVLARSEVVDKSDKELARDRMISRVLFGAGPSVIQISVTQGAVKKKGLTTYTVPVEIRIPIAQLTTIPGAKGLDGKFRVMSVTASPDGDVSEVSEKQQTFHIPAKDVEKAKAGAFTYTMEIVVRDTSVRAVVSVTDALDNDSGYAEIPLDLTKVAKSTPAKNPNTPAWQNRPPGSRGGTGSSGRWP